MGEKRCTTTFSPKWQSGLTQERLSTKKVGITKPYTMINNMYNFAFAALELTTVANSRIFIKILYTPVQTCVNNKNT